MELLSMFPDDAGGDTAENMLQQEHRDSSVQNTEFFFLLDADV